MTKDQPAYRPPAARAPARVSALLRELTASLPVILGRNLVGVYLYGSLTQRAFDPRRSDVDLIVVTRRDLSDAQFRRLGAWLARASESNAWTTRLQMLFLIRDEVLTTDSKACLYQFGQLKRGGSDGNPIIWMNVLESGVVLYGPRPETFVPEITPEILHKALAREVGYLREEITEKPSSEWRDVPSYRAYAVLTLCRILYSHRHGTIVSKKRAANWALRNLPERWHEIITRALESGGERESGVPLSRIRKFIAFADAQLHAVTPAHASNVVRRRQDN
ncbi:MAG TPA: aminoglycoside adenylyltransferase domain-containing protein [Pyrinomonadaceae bacterium]|jgi:hypothetical protein|nr:aminoglycoside adenylyltransferase domain-containing protein [Pyrinomonadaceae bacterium]